jgi:hypothetical protein
MKCLKIAIGSALATGQSPFELAFGGVEAML